MSAGQLLIIGGAEEKIHDGEVLSKFVELAGDKNSRIGILPTASEIPDDVSSDYIHTFKQLGVVRVEVINVATRECAEDPSIMELIDSLSAVFITGGDQSRLSELIGGTKLHETLMEKWKKGMVLAGTSAGASIMAKQMIVAADTKLNDDKLTVKLGTGFGFLDHVLIDQHFSQRARFDRLLSAIADNTEIIGIGIDENTAILVHDNKFKVYGEHQVLVMDGKSSNYVNVKVSENGSEELTISGFQLHTLTKGYSFDLANRKLILEKGIQE
ncbi:cyanophycinase [Peribacillus cavernae]|uniref:Cyanophycinase n=1 Tax=Peribacillus cavernae TaxID=1674310 RepID=A0A433HPG0_9BACI|nr:cyanophycinase [Peribacillus cavernae]MDQ0217339.1 cyanophycinase [Peribacillus cavernae]RUQ30207.1 cyanophycinase [Peribacillus cavernae]